LTEKNVFEIFFGHFSEAENDVIEIMSAIIITIGAKVMIITLIGKLQTFQPICVNSGGHHID
jgi:hypothetical protein